MGFVCAQLLVSWVAHFRSLLVLFVLVILAIALSILLQFTASDYPCWYHQAVYIGWLKAKPVRICVKYPCYQRPFIRVIYNGLLSIKHHDKLLINTMHVGISVLSFAVLDVYCASSGKQQLVVTHVARHFLYFSASQTLLQHYPHACLAKETPANKLIFFLWLDPTKIEQLANNANHYTSEVV